MSSVLQIPEEAKRARRIASQLSSDEDRTRLLEYADEVEAEAEALARQEKQSNGEHES